MTKKKVCVVGAGVAGLTSVKNSLDYDFEPICFEKDEDLGGLWNYHDEPVDGRPSLYNSCSINTSKELSCYSDFPIPKEFPNFMGHKHFKKYLHLYADNFKLKNYIKFHHSVEKVERAEDFADTGRWVITVKNLKTGKFEKHVTDFVIVCNGHLHEPSIPEFPGIKQFNGKVMHTRHYKTFKGYENKKVLVVGIGNSGADIASELSRHAEHVYVATRRGTYMIQRAGDYGIPFDHLAVNRFSQRLPWSLMRPVFFNRINQRYKHSNYGLSPNYSFDAGVVTISDDLPNRILYGRLSVKCNVKEFTENGAIFDDGTVLNDIDVVIFATGFNFSIPFLEEGVIKLDGHYPHLFELVFPTELNPCTLAVVGLVQPFGALPPILEMQARFAASVFNGETKLPSISKRMEAAEQRLAFIKSKYVDSPRYSLQVYFIQYLDKISKYLGCKPNLWKHFFKSPRLWYKIYFGPSTPPQWRLDGPKAWAGAKESIENVQYNTYYPMKTRQSGEGEMDGLYDGWIKLGKKIAMYLFILFLLRFLYVNGYTETLASMVRF